MAMGNERKTSKQCNFEGCEKKDKRVLRELQEVRRNEPQMAKEYFRPLPRCKTPEGNATSTILFQFMPKSGRSALRVE